MELDRTDAEILRALQEDARQSFRKIARRIGVSVPTVSARVANLERLGILAGYHAAIDPERLHQARLVLVVTCRANMADAVGEALAKFPEVRWTIRTRGSRVVAEAVVRRSSDIDAFLGKLRATDGVLSHEYHVAAKRFKDAPQALLSGSLSAAVTCFECGKAIDEKPIKLLIGGRHHYLCCPSCERLYRERYSKIRAAARED